MDMRPRGATTPMYNPERDLADITPTVMHTALAQLDIDNRLPHVRETIAAAGLTEEQIGEAAMKFAEVQRLYVYSGGAIKSPWDAFEASGFAVLPTVLHDLSLQPLVACSRARGSMPCVMSRSLAKKRRPNRPSPRCCPSGVKSPAVAAILTYRRCRRRRNWEVLRHRVLALSAMVERQRGVMETQVARIHELETEIKAGCS